MDYIANRTYSDQEKNKIINKMIKCVFFQIINIISYGVYKWKFRYFLNIFSIWTCWKSPLLQSPDLPPTCSSLGRVGCLAHWKACRRCKSRSLLSHTEIFAPQRGFESYRCTKNRFPTKSVEIIETSKWHVRQLSALWGSAVICLWKCVWSGADVAVNHKLVLLQFFYKGSVLPSFFTGFILNIRCSPEQYNLNINNFVWMFIPDTHSLWDVSAHVRAEQVIGEFTEITCSAPPHVHSHALPPARCTRQHHYLSRVESFLLCAAWHQSPGDDLLFQPDSLSTVWSSCSEKTNTYKCRCAKRKQYSVTLDIRWKYFTGFPNKDTCGWSLLGLTSINKVAGLQFWAALCCWLVNLLYY